MKLSSLTKHYSAFTERVQRGARRCFGSRLLAASRSLPENLSCDNDFNLECLGMVRAAGCHCAVEWRAIALRLDDFLEAALWVVQDYI